MSAVVTNKATHIVITFYVGDYCFAIEVNKVQEVTGISEVYPVPLASAFVLGLINLRGQIATALSLREFFKHKDNVVNIHPMSVVCRIDGGLISMVVDRVGDVIEVQESLFEKTPETIELEIQKYIKGIYKTNNGFLSLLDIEVIAKELSPHGDSSSVIAS